MRRVVAARRLIGEGDPLPALFSLGRYLRRVWITKLGLGPAAAWHSCDGRAATDTRLCEPREDFALRRISTVSLGGNPLYLNLIRLACNPVAAFQRTYLPESWQSYTLPELRLRLYLLPARVARTLATLTNAEARADTRRRRL